MVFSTDCQFIANRNGLLLRFWFTTVKLTLQEKCFELMVGKQ